MVRYLALLTLTGCSLLFGNFVCEAQSAEPLKAGYERWNNTPVVSGAVFGQELQTLYGVYTDKPKLFGTPSVPCGRRLIDLDVFYSPEQKKYLCNAVWIENKGDYKADSFMLYGLTYDEVQALSSVREWMILDVESYDHSPFSTQYAVIVRSNPHRYKTKLMLSLSLSELQDALEDKRWRPIDVDVHQNPLEYVDLPSQYDEDMNGFDAVFVAQESSQNRLNTFVVFGDRDSINAVNYGQVVDVEATGQYFEHYFPDSPYLYIVVEAGSSFTFEEEMTGAEIVASLYDINYYYDVEKRTGRCIALEGGAFNPDYNPLGIRAVFKNN